MFITETTGEHREIAVGQVDWGKFSAMKITLAMLASEQKLRSE